jgi:hypothetical protein
MTDEGEALVSFTTGLIAGALSGKDSALNCEVFYPTFSTSSSMATLPITTRSGIQLEILVREVGE